MNKKELIEVVADRTGYTKSITKEVLDEIISTITDTVSEGADVIIPGFASFKVVERPARKGRNPQTGKTIDIPARNALKFKAGKTLKDAVA